MGFDQILEKAGKVKLSGGIFSKLTWAIIIICICVTVMARDTNNIYVLSLSITALLMFAIYFFNKLLSFAEKYPQLAILDGGEFLIHEKMKYAMKDGGLIENHIAMIDHPQLEMDGNPSEAVDVIDPKQIGDR